MPSPATRAAIERARQALQLGDFGRAERDLLGALASAPGSTEALRLMATLRNAQGRHAEAVDLLRHSLQLREDDALAHNSLGNALGRLGDKAGAVAAFARACELAPHVAAFRYNHGKALVEDARDLQALPVLEQALRLAPDDARIGFLHARTLRVSGRPDEAAERYRTMLRADPGSAEAWLGLNGLKHLRFDAADVAAMERVRNGKLSIDDANSIRFALARGYEDVDRYEDAYRTYLDANAHVRRRIVWDAAAFSARVDEFLAVDVADVPDGMRGSEVVFIVGMPRSGSSLTEQILASHPQVDGAGELPDLPEVLREESQRRGKPFPHWVAEAGADDWRRLGERYLERTARWRRERPRFTDKLPDNWRHVGAIAAMLPGARVVVCRRDPLETALACFRELFAGGGQAFSYDIADIGAYSRDFDRAARHWLLRHPERVCPQGYEALLADPEGQVRALLDFCALPFDPACLRFHETVRVVRTASATQVREPLRRPTLRAPKYGALLDPLRAALGLPALAQDAPAAK
ncbi:MAG: sulfotransferase [Rudaea sp.]|uniref:tetratricopeptide repeat-containing sulfotransferase family protein n=1 Tax=Rudaea sp. TaxID=2136325 RepID=UPI0039E5CACD